MALDLSMKSRKRSHRDSESGPGGGVGPGGRATPPTIRTESPGEDGGPDGVLDLSLPPGGGTSKKRTLSQSSACSDYSDTGSVTRRLERTRLQSRTPPTVPAQRLIRQGGFVMPGPYSPTFVRTGSVSAGNSPAAGTAFGSHFQFPPPGRSHSHSHSLSPTSSQHALPPPAPSSGGVVVPSPATVTSSHHHPHHPHPHPHPHHPFSSYMSYSLSSHQLHHAAQLVHARRSLTPPSLTPPSYRRKMLGVNPGVSHLLWARLQDQALKGGSTSTYYTDSEDEGSHTPTKVRTRSETSLRPPPFTPAWCRSALKHQRLLSDTPPSSPEGHVTPPEGHLTPPTPTTADDDDDVFISYPSDPRDWTKEDLHHWLKDMQNKFSIKELKLDRFRMNGRALVLMNADMFLHRVPVGGDLLFKDFRTRLRKSTDADKAKARARMLRAAAKQAKEFSSVVIVGGAKNATVSSGNSFITTRGPSPARDITNEQNSPSLFEKPTSLSTSSTAAPSGGEKENVKPRLTAPSTELRKSSSDPGLCDSATSCCEAVATADKTITNGNDSHSNNSSNSLLTNTDSEEKSRIGSFPGSPPEVVVAAEREPEIENRPDSPILDVTTVDEEESPLEGGTPVTCVA